MRRSRVLYWASRQHTECFILRIAKARLCFNCFKEFTINALKNLPTSIYTPSSTSPCKVRRHQMIFYANASVRRLISARLTWIHHFYSLFIIRFSHITMLYSNIALQTHSRCYMANIAQGFTL